MFPVRDATATDKAIIGAPGNAGLAALQARIVGMTVPRRYRRGRAGTSSARRGSSASRAVNGALARADRACLVAGRTEAFLPAQSPLNQL